MELLELVEYDPATRPFRCDWDSCNKVSVILMRFVFPILTCYPELQPQIRPPATLQTTHERAPLLLLQPWLWQELHPA
jgi:hypothetical protein